MSLSQQIATRAKSIVDTVRQTAYQHTQHIDAEAGIYDCDCNGYVGYVLMQAAPEEYRLITREPGQPRPRAFKYFEYFASVTPDTQGAWRRIDLLQDARPGDVMAWRFPTIEADENTGHVMIIASVATSDTIGLYDVQVYDSAAKPHFADTRGTGEGQFPTGVGAGVIKLRMDADGRPVAFLFAPPETAELSYLQIAIGRVQTG